MYKKFMLPFILALVAAMAFSNVAFAATTNAENMRYVGTVLWVNQTSGAFKFETNGLVRLTIHVNNATLYRGLPNGFADLQASDYLNVQVAQDENGQYVATYIYKYEPTSLVSTVNGTVTSISESSFTLLGIDGVTYELQVNSGTTFVGAGVPHFRQLATGMAVRVTFRNQGAGQLIAQEVVIRHIPQLY